MNIQVINKSKHPLPAYATELSAGMDIRANLSEPITLEPLQRCLVPTGLYIALPKGFEAQVRPRSGLAIKKGITVLNSPGTIDADYRGEVCVILVNLSSEAFVIEVINKSKHPLPAYATELSAGMDIRANLSEPITLEPLQRCLVPTGLYIALPKGFEAQVRPRSGLAIKKGITVLNSPGTIDADYRGEVCVILVNLSSEAFVIEDGERIAQMVIAKHEQPVWQEVEVLDETERGAGGFGHTGV